MSTPPNPAKVTYHRITCYNYSKSFYIGMFFDSALAFIGCHKPDELVTNDSASRCIVKTVTDKHGYVTNQTITVEELHEAVKVEVEAWNIPAKAEAEVKV